MYIKCANGIKYPILICCFFFPFINYAKTIHVSSSATDPSNGSFAKPYDILTVFYGKVDVLPGDTIFLRRGIYKGVFECCLQGTPQKPIVIKSYPGEWAVVQGYLMAHINCSYVVFMDFEITSDFTESPNRVSSQKGSTVHNIPSNAGFIFGSTVIYGIKAINLVIHDIPGDGMQLWSKAINCEAYGNIIYNNGWDGPDRGHGHGIYTQNDTGKKIIEDNICFWNMGSCGIKIYTEHGSTQNYYLEGNIHLGYDWFLVGGYQPVKNILMVDNYMGEGSKLSLGYGSLLPNNNLTLKGNYIMNTTITKCMNLELIKNTILGSINIVPQYNISDTSQKFDYNYYPATNIFYGNQKLDFTKYNSLGYDKHGQHTDSLPEKPTIIIRPNKYEKGRGNIVIYNWKKADSVLVNLSSVLKMGDTYEIKDVQHLSGLPVTKGTFKGEMVSIPMNLNEVDTMKGNFAGCYHCNIVHHPHTSAAFGVYVLNLNK